MSKIKTVQTSGKTVSVQGELRILSENKGLQQKVEIWLLNEDVNNNDWQYLNIEEHRKLFAETPILVAYVGNKIGDGHNYEEIRNADGSVSASFMSATAERIVGYFKDESDIRIEEVNGKKWVVGIGYIWKWYAKELVAKLEKLGLQGMSVSIETLIDEMYKRGSTEVFTKYQILGCTILGDDVSPAVTGANIKALSAIGVDGIKNLTRLKVASENKNCNQENPQTKKQGEKRTMKKKELETQFSDFTVLAVDGNNVALLSKKGIPHLCTVQRDGENVICGVKSEAKANAVFSNGETEMSVSVEEIVETLIANNAELEEKLAKAEENNETITNALKAMQTAEHNRRKGAVKSALLARLAEINENRCDKFDASICDELMTDEKIEEYASLEDKDCKWIGDISACKDLDSICMNKSIDFDKQRANSQKGRKAWEIAANSDNGTHSDDPIDALLNNIQK